MSTRKVCNCGCGADRWYTRHEVPYWVILLAVSVIFLLMIAISWPAHAQSGPCLRQTETALMCYVGPTHPGDRFAVGVTRSVNTNDYGPQFAEATEQPDRWYGREQVRVIDPADVGEDRDTGWIVLPIPSDVKIEVPYGSGHWVFDAHMKLQVHYAPVGIGLCSVSACGSTLILRRGDLSLIMLMSTTSKRRAITP